jgi:hypothetical protein
MGIRPIGQMLAWGRENEEENIECLRKGKQFPTSNIFQQFCLDFCLNI